MPTCLVRKEKISFGRSKVPFLDFAPLVMNPLKISCFLTYKLLFTINILCDSIMNFREINRFYKYKNAYENLSQFKDLLNMILIQKPISLDNFFFFGVLLSGDGEWILTVVSIETKS